MRLDPIDGTKNREVLGRAPIPLTPSTQNDLAAGRSICLLGVASTKPTEFVNFRIGPSGRAGLTYRG